MSSDALNGCSDVDTWVLYVFICILLVVNKFKKGRSKHPESIPRSMPRSIPTNTYEAYPFLSGEDECPFLEGFKKFLQRAPEDHNGFSEYFQWLQKSASGSAPVGCVPLWAITNDASCAAGWRAVSEESIGRKAAAFLQDSMLFWYNISIGNTSCIVASLGNISSAR